MIFDMKFKIFFLGKFGLYEYFKNMFLTSSVHTKLNSDRLYIIILFISSALAEIAASWVLCPLEVAKITIVTNPTGIKLSTMAALSYIIQKNGLLGLFKGLPLILLRQVPYTCCKLAGYEIISDTIYNGICRYNNKNEFCNNYIRNDSNNQIEYADGNGIRQIELLHDSTNNKNGIKKKCNNEKATTGWIPFISGIFAGVFAAIVSHPADVLLSMSCQTNANFCIDGNFKGLIAVINAFKMLGVKGCYAGLLPRAVMIGLITAAQFFVYEKVKALFLAQRN